MVPVKIQCGCGQKYAFEVDPVGGEMPWVVQCPVCGVDGTSAANMAIAQSLAAQPAMALAGAGSMRLSGAPPAAASYAPPAHEAPPPVRTPSSRPTRLPGQLEPAQAEIEAKAKISWGDSPEDVTKFLMLHGFTVEDARALVNEMFEERAKHIRKNGITKIIVGTCMAFVPLVAWIIFLSMGFIPMKLFGLTIIIGLWGLGKVLKGIFMVVSPRTESGDVSDH